MKKIQYIFCSYMLMLCSVSYAYDPSFLTNNPLSSDFQNKGVYGEDDRKEFFEVQPGIQRISQSVAAFIFSDQLVLDETGDNYLLKSRPAPDICKEEAFSEQPRISFCSGFVINDKYVASAGHCMVQGSPPKPYKLGDACEKISVVFGYQLSAQGKIPKSIPAKDVYQCKRVVVKTLENKEDYAVIEVDRILSGHPPLAISGDAKISTHESVGVIGFPYGLPMKIAAGATVRDNEQSGYFSTDLDTFGGNSGSPVFNTTSLINGEAKIEGILVRGATDFVNDSNRGCRKVSQCTIQDAKTRRCGGEDVTRISKIKSFAKLIHSRPAETLQISAQNDKVRLGEELKLDLNIPQAGYLNVLEVNPEGKYTLLFPNGYEKNNRVSAGKMTITDAKSWKLEILSGPYGQHQVFAVLSKEPVNLYQKKSIDLQGEMQTFAPSSVEDLVGLTRGAGATARVTTDCNSKRFGETSKEGCQEKPQIKSTQVCYFENANDCP